MIQVSDLEEKLEKLYSAVRDYVDPTNRMICEIFMHLPTKQVLPDYYKVIKKPIDMDRIQIRMQVSCNSFSSVVIFQRYFLCSKFLLGIDKRCEDGVAKKISFSNSF